MVIFNSAQELVDFLNGSHIVLDVSQAQLILDYMEGHDYALGYSNVGMVREDLAKECGEVEEYSIVDAICAACEWNYELMLCSDDESGELASDAIILGDLFDKYVVEGSAYGTV